MSTPEIKAKAIDRLQALLHDVQRGDFYAADFARILAGMMKPDALRGLAAEQDEQEGGRA